MNNYQRIHLADEEFVALILDNLSAEREDEIDQHLATCRHCATKLESFYEAQHSFPNEEWLSHRKSFIANLQQQIIRPKEETVPKENTVMSRLIVQLQALTLPRADWSLSLATAQAATGEQLEDGQTDDGTLRWRIVEDEERNLMIRLGSHEIALEGVELRMQSGSWQQLVVLQKVAPDQIGAEAIISREQRTKLDVTAKLQIEPNG